MIEIKTIGVWGFEGSLRGCRMPYESFDKSDSGICVNGWNCTPECYQHYEKSEDECVAYRIGPADMSLCKKLIKGGSEHRKFLRMIHVQCEIRAPRYWLTELDTYKVGTVRNSSSTMHLITKRELSINDFSRKGGASTGALESIIDTLNMLIRCYNLSSDAGLKQQWFMTIKQLLPESFMQRIIWDANYEVLMSIYHQRRNHRLTEWREFCDWCLSLPYFEEFVGVLNGKD